jgi:hypothetical protein
MSGTVPQPTEQDAAALRAGVPDGLAYQTLAHAQEYDPTFPDGKPYFCNECDEAFGEGEECGHNADLTEMWADAYQRGLAAHPEPTPASGLVENQ